MAIAQCANALPTDSLLALSAFFMLSEALKARYLWLKSLQVDHPQGRLPCLDLTDGCRRASWEQCNIETFTETRPKGLEQAKSR